MSASTSMVGITSNHNSQSMTMQADQNSIQLFKHNIQVILENVLSLQNVARNTLLGIQNAYHPGSSPTQTEANIVALKQNLEILADLSVHTGVGALPLLPFPPVPTHTHPNSLHDPSSSAEESAVPSEAQMITDTDRSIQILFERLKRVQESAGTVANLLQAPTTNVTQ
ncbi:hypothetical protein BT96DRAFT_1012065 [Gymnopus androsaceus JB14]|uniref:Uncharacterized protein n=1 Tax=Gymnopus androsaceus JB14 TaxID=1447944 RepID=A0A6A4IE50_9AGAR|nr:hypothetical protein BT96DRAFT_1012065 [Gymnopus androsaceus JB14]